MFSQSRNLSILLKSSIVLAVLLLAACNQSPNSNINLGSNQLVHFDISYAGLNQAQGLGTQAIPFENALAVVTRFEVQVFDAVDQLVTFNNQNGIDPDGSVDTLIITPGTSLPIALTTGDYSFTSKGFAPNKLVGPEVLLAIGTNTATVNVDTTGIALSVKTITDSFSFQNSAPLNFILPGQTLDLMLLADAPGGYQVPLTDYTVDYTLDMDNIDQNFNSIRGSRLLIKDILLDNDISAVATVTGTKDDGTLFTLAGIDGLLGIPFLTSDIGLSIDIEAPSFTFPEPTLVDGIATVLAGTADDNIGVEKVQIFDGPVLIGSSLSTEFALANVAEITFTGTAWTMNFTPGSGIYNLFGVAFDTSGNQSIIEY